MGCCGGGGYNQYGNNNGGNNCHGGMRFSILHVVLLLGVVLLFAKFAS